MNLKANAIILFVGILMGGFGVYKYMEKPKSKPVAKEEVKLDKKNSGTIVRYLPNPNCGGAPVVSEVENYNSEVKSERKTEPAILPDNIKFGTNHKLSSFDATFRLDQIPIPILKDIMPKHTWVGLGYEKELLYKLEYSDRIF